jgi:chemotaxis protein MotB
MKYVLLVTAMSGIILSSCSTGKKLEAANGQIQSLTSQVESQSKKLAENEKLISELKTENIQYSKEAENCRKLEMAMRDRVEKLNGALAEQGTSLQKIYAQAQSALQKFEDAGVDVTYKNGLVHISMQDKLLFPSGSVTLNKDAYEALKLVADVVQDFSNVKIIVVGNTDGDGVGKAYKDNWSLSTERANTVVRLFRDKYGIDPVRLTAAGKSKYNPVAPNTTAENKAQNRRTEIILNPDLSKLWDLMEK